MLEVFRAFFQLGLTSFGGPIAHLAYFQREFVARRGWLDDAQYAQLIAIAQFLPGPASSQIGFSIGLMRAGWLGGLAAFVAFTLPSAVLMFAFAHLVPHLDHAVGQAVLHGFKLLAVAVVAQGVLAMAKRLTTQAASRLIAIVAAVAVILSGSVWMQLGVILLGGLAGVFIADAAESERSDVTLSVRYTKRTSAVLLSLFVVLLALSFTPAGNVLLIDSVKAFYRAGALVFGGAHVVLPLLEEAVVAPGWISSTEFFAGYGAAQSVPGPMFSVAAFLGARIQEQSSAIGSLCAVVAIFLPGLLLVAGVLPLWRHIMARRWAIGALYGINAAVVGLLAAALYDPVWVTAIHSIVDVAIVLGTFSLLVFMRTPVLIAIVFCVSASLVRAIATSG
jgi:chromate transporter